MTASQSCKSVRRARRLSTGHGRVRSPVPLSSQIVQQFMIFDATRSTFVGRITVEQLVGSARSKSISSPAALKSP
jgi:hypothetical protein